MIKFANASVATLHRISVIDGLAHLRNEGFVAVFAVASEGLIDIGVIWAIENIINVKSFAGERRIELVAGFNGITFGIDDFG